MFFKQAAFKRLLKEAYKGSGLYVGHQPEDEDGENEGIYLCGGYWVMWLLKETIPKEAKAAIIELAGDLPAPGEVFKAMKDFGNQYEIEQREFFNVPKSFAASKCLFDISKVSIQFDNRILRLLQEPTTNHIAAMNEIFFDLVDPSAVDYDDGETEPRGPFGDCPMAKFLYWGNERNYLMAGIVNTDGADETEF